MIHFDQLKRFISCRSRTRSLRLAKHKNWLRFNNLGTDWLWLKMPAHYYIELHAFTQHQNAHRPGTHTSPDLCVSVSCNHIRIPNTLFIWMGLKLPLIYLYAVHCVYISLSACPNRCRLGLRREKKRKSERQRQRQRKRERKKEIFMRFTRICNVDRCWWWLK